MPHTQRQGHRTKPIRQYSRLAVMYLPALPDGHGGGDEHHDASNGIHADPFHTASERGDGRNNTKLL